MSARVIFGVSSASGALLAREAPLTLTHRRNMLAVAEMGGTILPPVPAFYQRPEPTLEDRCACG